MRVLLTGATGFIGRCFVAGLISAGHEVVPAVRDLATANRLFLWLEPFGTLLKNLPFVAAVLALAATESAR